MSSFNLLFDLPPRPPARHFQPRHPSTRLFPAARLDASDRFQFVTFQQFRCLWLHNSPLDQHLSVTFTEDFTWQTAIMTKASSATHAFFFSLQVHPSLFIVIWITVLEIWKFSFVSQDKQWEDLQVVETYRLATPLPCRFLSSFFSFHSLSSCCLIFFFSTFEIRARFSVALTGSENGGVGW